MTETQAPPNLITFTLTVHDAPVDVSISLPRNADEQTPDAGLAVALLCSAPPWLTGDEALSALHHDLREALHKRRIALATYTPRCADTILDDFHQYTAQDNLDDAAAVIRALLVHDRVDENRVAVIGAGLSTITALGLSQRTQRIAARVLICPVLPADLTNRAGSSNVYAPLGSHAAPVADADVDLLPDRFRETIADMHVLDISDQRVIPTFILHAAADHVAPVENAVTCAEALADAPETSAAALVRTTLIPFASHLLPDPSNRAAATDAAATFLTDAM